VARTDSFLSLAVHYGVQPTAIKRINNMISDHSLHSRIFVHVPVAFADDLVGRAVQVSARGGTRQATKTRLHAPLQHPCMALEGNVPDSA
jgi:hypothetical protein